MAERVANGVRGVIVQMVSASIHQRPRAQLSAARSISERQHVTRSIAWTERLGERWRCDRDRRNRGNHDEF